MIAGTGSRARCPVSHSARSRWHLAAVEESWISAQKSSSFTFASYRFLAGRPRSARASAWPGYRVDVGHPVPPRRPRLRTSARASRNHGPLGDDHHHDPAPGPPAPGGSAALPAVASGGAGPVVQTRRPMSARRHQPNGHANRIPQPTARHLTRSRAPDQVYLRGGQRGRLNSQPLIADDPLLHADPPKQS